MQNQMRDPAAGVHMQLLPHLHLVSKYRYPSVNALSIETVVNHLLEAPKIVRDVQPMQWQFLDAPADGTVMLVWQPLEYMQTQFASDGYVWADVEHAFNHDAKGYTLEMYMHRSGFHPPNEQVASHSRKRYRLTPGKVAIPGQPPCDPSLWLIHYTKAERRDHYAAAQIPVQPSLHKILSERAFLARQGQLSRKEFMLHDKHNWPTITFPGQPAAPGGLPQQAALGRGGPAVGPVPAATRAGRAPRASLSMAEPTLEEEEDVSRGDSLDFLTPREISKMRYEQHHEWMEEIMGSPYHINQIVPVELGLGRKGAIEQLTNGFFTAPTAPLYESQEGAPTRVGKLDSEKAADFRKNAEEKLAAMAAELEQMKNEHAKRMALLQKSSVYTTAERRLRNAVEDPAAPRSEALKLERTRPGTDGTSGPKEKVSDIVSEIETQLNQMAVPLRDVNCVSKGGLEEKVEEPEPVVSPPKASEDVTMTTSNTMEPPSEPQQAQGLTSVPEQPTQARSPITIPTPPQPQAPDETTSSTAPPPVPPPTAVQNIGLDDPDNETAGMDVDIDMDGLDDEGGSGDAPADDWVMVNDEQNTATAPTTTAPTTANDPTQPPTSGDTQQQTQPQSSYPTTTLPSTSDKPEAEPQAMDQTADTAGDEVEAEVDLDTADFDLGGDSNFEEINTAGEALEGYDDVDAIDDGTGSGMPDELEREVGGPAGEGDDLDLGLDDSAFGEAFHPNDE